VNVDETYRMLGREREADFERAAVASRRAAEVRAAKRRPITETRADGSGLRDGLTRRLTAVLAARSRKSRPAVSPPTL